MGATIELLKWSLRLGAAVLAVTVAAVLYFSDANWRQHRLGRGLDAPLDALLVLGGGIDGDRMLSYSSRRRVALAVKLLREGKTQRLILLGGPNWIPPELTGTALMRRYALTLGAPAEALLTEANSISTFENLRFGFALAEREGFRRLAVLTDAYHLERAAWLATYLGQPEIGLVAAPGFAHDKFALRVWGIVREALAWWYNLAKIAAWELLALAGVDLEAPGAGPMNAGAAPVLAGNLIIIRAGRRG